MTVRLQTESQNQRKTLVRTEINPLKTEYTLLHYILEESVFDSRYVRLYDIDIYKKDRLTYLQTVETLIRRRVLRRMIWVCTVCQLPI